jgi:hypothetical protein
MTKDRDIPLLLRWSQEYSALGIYLRHIDMSRNSTAINSKPLRSPHSESLGSKFRLAEILYRHSLLGLD